jgi:hypothetical protein
VKIALGLTAAVPRNAGKPLPMPGERVGDHFRLQDWSQLSRDERISSTQSFRELVDLIFTRPLDKAQATALFAATNWQGSGTIPGGLAIGELDLLGAMNKELRPREGIFSLVLDSAKVSLASLDPVQTAHFLLAHNIDLDQVIRFVPYGPAARTNAFGDWAAAVTRELERVTGRQLEAYAPRSGFRADFLERAGDFHLTNDEGAVGRWLPVGSGPQTMSTDRAGRLWPVDEPEYIEFPGGVAHLDADEAIPLAELKKQDGLFTAVITQLTWVRDELRVLWRTPSGLRVRHSVPQYVRFLREHGMQRTDELRLLASAPPMVRIEDVIGEIVEAFVDATGGVVHYVRPGTKVRYDQELHDLVVHAEGDEDEPADWGMGMSGAHTGPARFASDPMGRLWPAAKPVAVPLPNGLLSVTTTQYRENTSILGNLSTAETDFFTAVLGVDGNGTPLLPLTDPGSNTATAAAAEPDIPGWLIDNDWPPHTQIKLAVLNPPADQTAWHRLRAAAAAAGRELHKYVVIPNPGSRPRFIRTSDGLRVDMTNGWHVIRPDDADLTDEQLFTLFNWI